MGSSLEYYPPSPENPYGCQGGQTAAVSSFIKYLESTSGQIPFSWLATEKEIQKQKTWQGKFITTLQHKIPQQYKLTPKHS